ncbi:MAG TPA: cation:proton antiporter, partial [Alphaproteobacteria bacterium]|nr:cation:proton antiporter [Alphaproteobacteria bacterium]
AAAGLFAGLPVSSSTFIYVFLPLLIFEAGIATDVRRTVEDAAAILLLAVVATLVTTAVIGFALWPFARVPLVVCLLLGAVVATTDPAAVIAIFRDVGAPARLTRLVEGEALLNDAAAISLFVVLLAMILTGREPDAIAGLSDFAVSFVGGGMVGFFAGRLLIWIIPRLGDDRLAEATLTLAFAYLAFIAAERMFHVSGVVAVLVSGLALSALGPSRISPGNWSFLADLWGQIAFWARSLIFVLASILVPRLLVDIGYRDVLLLAILIAAALGARIFALFVLLPPLERLGLIRRIEASYKLAITWGGLRGALTLVLALAVTENAALPREIQRFVAVLATGFVLFTLFVNGTTLRIVIGLLGLNRLSPRDRALRDRILALSYAEAREAAQAIAQTHALSSPALERVIVPYEAKIAAANVGETPPASLTERDRLAIALVALGNKERGLVLEMLGDRTASPAAAEVLLGNADAITEAARSEGRLGYQRASEATLAFPLGFRIAYFLYRRLGIVRPLADRLAERAETLLIMRVVIERLHPFNDQQIRSLFGERIAGVAGEILDLRRDAIAAALDALRRQYPDYAAELEARFLRQSTLRHEMTRYQSLFDEGLIAHEVYDDLKRSVLGARAAQQRPRFDIGLDTRQLIERLDILAGLDEGQLDRVCRLLRPRLAVPKDRIVRKGERGDAVFFIASGAVEVVLPERRVRLGSGEFFGEMALLSGQPRRADVVALSYCQLLVLRRSDFERFMAANPEARTTINRVAEARLAMNTSERGKTVDSPI